MKFSVDIGLRLPQLKNYETCTISIESTALKKNPLGDPHIRHHPVLIPRSKPTKNGFPVVFILAGFTGNGPNYFGMRSFENNFPQVIDQQTEKGEAPRALYVFVDAFSSWGGSQFLDSSAVGKYESHIINELGLAVAGEPDVSEDPKHWCVMGGSSGGYGALHLASKYPDLFGLVGALAPDSFFEACYLSDLYKAAPTLTEYKTSSSLLRFVQSGEIQKKKGWHEILNAIGMSACYSPKGKDFEYPINLETGELVPRVWKKWKSHDPVEFLKTRQRDTKKIKGVFLEVGTRDQFALYLGARQVRDVLKRYKVPTQYFEFSGSHFDLATRRPEFLRWLVKKV